MTDDELTEIEKFITEPPDASWKALLLQCGLYLAKLIDEVRRLREAARWRRLGDEKPPDMEVVLFSAYPMLNRSKEAYYDSMYDTWDHGNWKHPRDAHHDDLWLPIPTPDEK